MVIAPCGPYRGSHGTLRDPFSELLRPATWMGKLAGPIEEFTKDGIIYIIWIMWLSNVKYGYIQMGSFVDIYIYI